VAASDGRPFRTPVGRGLEIFVYTSRVSYQTGEGFDVGSFLASIGIQQFLLFQLITIENGFL
jgi:hypothetical protein